MEDGKKVESVSPEKSNCAGNNYLSSGFTKSLFIMPVCYTALEF